MTKPTRLHLYFTLAFLLLAVVFGSWRKDRFMFEKYAAEISNYLSTQEFTALDWLEKERPAVQNSIAGRADEPNAAPQIWQRNNFVNQEFTLFLQTGDSIVFWNNNKIIPAKEDFPKIQNAPERSLIHLPTGIFYAFHRTFDKYKLTLLVPVRYENFSTGHHVFPANESISGKLAVVSNTQITNSPTTNNQFPVIVNGQTIGQLIAEGDVKFVNWQWATFIAGLIFLFLYFGLINKFSMWAARRHGSTLGSAALILPIAAFLGALHFFDVPEHFDGMGLFSKNLIDSSLGNSLGEWLLNIFVLLWLMVFFHREFKAKDWGQLPTWFRVSLGVVFNCGLMMSIVMTIRLFKELMFNSNINFDFDNIMNLSRYSLVAIFGITLLLAGLFLFSHRMMLTIFKIDLTRHQRMLSAVIAGVIIFIACSFWKEALKVPASGIVAFSWVYVVAFDYFIEGKSPGFEWIISWLFIFSFFSAQLLYRYNYLTDFDKRLACAKALTIDRDSTAEVKLDSFQKKLAIDTSFDRQISPLGFDTSTAILQNFIARLISSDAYLFQHYKTSVFVFEKDNDAVQNDQNFSHKFVVKDNWEKGKSVAGNPMLRMVQDAVGNVKYMIYRPSVRNNEAKFPVDAYLFFDHDYPNPTKVYSSLFFQTNFKNLPDLNRFDYSIYKNGSEVVRLVGGNQVIDNSDLVIPAPDTYYDLEKDGERTDVVYTGKNGATAVVGRHIGSGARYLYLFSSLFTLLSMFMMLLGGINSKIRILPDYYQFYISTKGSLAKRIQIWTVTLIVATFFALGFFSFRHFRAASSKQEFKQLEYRTMAMLNHLGKITADLPPEADSLEKVLPKVIEPIAASFTADVNLYSRDGNLLYTTQQKLQQAGILSQKINAEPFLRFTEAGKGTFTGEERVGDDRYAARYATLLNRQKQVLGFISVPYYLNESRVAPEVSNFMGILATMYVFLLVLAGSVAVIVARSIIKPIQFITDDIVKLRIEEKYQPLVYQGDGQDELSALIAEYNRMVARLADSQQQLIKFERDQAWRVMANQVAHDIKNGLSPMKLTTQQLQKISDGDPQRLKEYLKKAIGGLIEQIDALAQIASEFSLLAKLEIGEKQEISLSSMVETVFGMYAYSEDIDYQINISPEEIFIMADKGNLMRVLNNLAINASQSIPSDRRGIIRASLYLNENGEKAVLRVGDNGGGIPEEVIPKIFEPNFTTKTTGSGIGLAISKRIVEAHDGVIYFETRQEVGTDFFVVLPVKRVETD